MTLDEFVEAYSTNYYENRATDKEINAYERYLRKIYAEIFKHKD